MRPVVALLSDFGLRDHYAGTMKAVVLGICPETTLVDISHDVPPHDVLTAALELAASYKYFPAGTIFLVVVDPGVGSARRGIAADIGDYRLVAPDNGGVDGSAERVASEARGGADRTALCEADGEQDLRRARPVCAGCRMAGEGRRPVGARAISRRHQAAVDSSGGGR
jgi:hypothetical protein